MKYAIYEDPITHRFAHLPLPSRFVDGDELPAVVTDRWFESHDAAIAGLSPHAQAELGQLIALLALPPVRYGIARVSDAWPVASPAQVRRFLDNCRASRFTLMRAAYDALHALTFAAWYGNASSWPAIGYPGPPQVTA